MQWIYIICFALISAGLLALFGVRPGDFIDALFRSRRKAATLSDELNVLMGTPAKGFFNQDYELKQILKGTGRSDRYEAVKRLSLILFAVGAVLALLINNVYMVPILGIGFSLAPIWYLRSTAAMQGGNFIESSHLTGRGHLIDLIRIFENENPGLPMRVDHGRMMLGDEDKGYNPGYSFHGRMLALAQVEGMMAVVDDEKRRQIIL